jgi:hypothetical protein
MLSAGDEKSITDLKINIFGTWPTRFHTWFPIQFQESISSIICVKIPAQNLNKTAEAEILGKAEDLSVPFFACSPWYGRRHVTMIMMDGEMTGGCQQCQQASSIIYIQYSPALPTLWRETAEV